MTPAAPRPETLSNREREIAMAYTEGQTYKQIAQTLGLSPATVRTHLRTVYRKLTVTSKFELTQALLPSANHALLQVRDNAALVAELALELDEAVRRERVLAKVIRIISTQGDRLDDVIDAVLDHAFEICEAEFGILFDYHGDLRFRAKQSRNISPAFDAWLTGQDIFTADPETGLGRVATRLTAVNITDVRGEDIYKSGAPLRIATADLGKARSFVAIPMMRGDDLLGAFTIYRTRVHPFNDRSLELAQLFADQAAIAIENARSRHGNAALVPDPPGHGERTDKGAEIPLLAILPFRAADDSDMPLITFGRRLASSLLMEMSSSPLFRVIDQASSFSPRLAETTPLEAADKLDARLVVSGTIRRLLDGGYRIAPVLYEAGRPAPRWTELFESHGQDTDALFERLLTRLCAAIGSGVERQLVDGAQS